MSVSEPAPTRTTSGSPCVISITDGGHCGIEPTSVIDMTHGEPEVVRVGAGSLTDIGLSAPA